MTWLFEVKWREKTWARDDTQFSIFLFIICVFINGFCLEHIHADCFCYIRMCNKLLVKSKFFFLVSKRLLAICRIKDKRLDGSPGVLCTSLYRMSSGKSIAGSCANSSTPRGLKDDVFVCVCVCVFYPVEHDTQTWALGEGPTLLSGLCALPPSKYTSHQALLFIHPFLFQGRFLIFPFSFSLTLVIAYVLSCQLCLTLCNSLEPARLPGPWNFSGKHTGGGCFFLLQHYTKRRKDKIKHFREKNSRCLPLESPHVSAIHHVLFLQISSFI